MSDGSGRRQTRKRWKRKQTAWFQHYRAVLQDGSERCRFPRCTNPARHFGHLRAHSAGGRFARDNLTLVCPECDARMGTYDWTGCIPSLADRP